MPTPEEFAALQALHAREHGRRCALETFVSRLALLVGQDLLDRAWAEMEQRHGEQPQAEEASE